MKAGRNYPVEELTGIDLSVAAQSIAIERNDLIDVFTCVEHQILGLIESVDTWWAQAEANPANQEMYSVWIEKANAKIRTLQWVLDLANIRSEREDALSYIGGRPR